MHEGDSSMREGERNNPRQQSSRADLLAGGRDAGDDHRQLAIHGALDLLLRAVQGTGSDTEVAIKDRVGCGP